ncbi:hypothetical protein DSTSK_29850 [Desulforhabdus sp. TSK]|nr:hypothetical protein DSTSK_29850 [Desulforhabdus sp. TSK]
MLSYESGELAHLPFTLYLLRMKSFVFVGAASSRDVSGSRLEAAPTKSMERPENVTS